MDGGIGVRFDGVVTPPFSLFVLRFTGVRCTDCFVDDDGAATDDAGTGTSSFDDNEMISISTGSFEQWSFSFSFSFVPCRSLLSFG